MFASEPLRGGRAEGTFDAPTIPPDHRHATKYEAEGVMWGHLKSLNKVKQVPPGTLFWEGL